MGPKEDLEFFKILLINIQDPGDQLVGVVTGIFPFGEKSGIINLTDQQLFRLFQNIIDIFIVQIESAAVISGSFRNFPYGDLFNAFVFIELPECLLEGLLCGFAGRCFFAYILLPLLSLFYSFLLFYHRADWYTRRLQGISKLWDCRLKIAENKTIIIYKSP